MDGQRRHKHRNCTQGFFRGSFPRFRPVLLKIVNFYGMRGWNRSKSFGGMLNFGKIHGQKTTLSASGAKPPCNLRATSVHLRATSVQPPCTSVQASCAFVQPPCDLRAGFVRLRATSVQASVQPPCASVQGLCRGRAGVAWARAGVGGRGAGMSVSRAFCLENARTLMVFVWLHSKTDQNGMSCSTRVIWAALRPAAF